MKILLVDDTSDMLGAVGALLTSWGHTVVVAERADSGHQILIKHSMCESPFDLLICDRHCPEEDSGLDLLWLAKEGFEEMDRVLMSTDFGDLEKVAKEFGAECLKKPFEQANLFRIVNSIEKKRVAIKRAPGMAGFR